MAFRGGDPVLPDENILRPDCLAYVGEVDGKIAAASTVLALSATRDGAVLPCAGIAAVGVLPEQRRTGVGSAMMAGILPLLRDKFVLASLYPYRGAYYRRFGYQFCGARFGITCPVPRLPKLDAELSPRELPYEKREELRPCYEQFALQFSGMSIRTEHTWWRALGGDSPFLIYVFGEPIEGYVTLRLNADFWVEQAIRETVWTTPRAYRSILAFFSAIGINKTAISWREPGDSPFYASFMDEGVKIELEHNIMFRIINLPAALSRSRCDQPGDVTFTVVDECVPENRGPWRVCFGPEGTRVEPAAEADFEIDIGHLTQAFLGGPSLLSLLRNGFVSIPDAAARGHALNFFRELPTYCMDYF